MIFCAHTQEGYCKSRWQVSCADRSLSVQEIVFANETMDQGDAATPPGSVDLPPQGGNSWGGLGGPQLLANNTFFSGFHTPLTERYHQKWMGSFMSADMVKHRWSKGEGGGTFQAWK